MSRVRPGDATWPSAASWDRLRRHVGGRLVKVQSPLAACVEAPSSPDCAHVFKKMKNPYYLGDSYQRTSNAADSLLIWTRRMNAVTLHDAFIGELRKVLPNVGSYLAESDFFDEAWQQSF